MSSDESLPIITKENSLFFNLKAEWFNKIASGEKTHEYREVKKSWVSKICYHNGGMHYVIKPGKKYARFMLGMSKDPSKNMLFEIKKISIVFGGNTDLKHNGMVFDIELGRRLQ